MTTGVLMNFIDRLVEQKISEAIARGELSGLPGEGAPLKFDDDSLIPEELRMAYRILRNAGFVPPEVQSLREIGDLERHIEELPKGGTRVRAFRKLQLLRMRLEASGRFQHVWARDSSYSDRLLEHLHGRSEPNGKDATASGKQHSAANPGAPGFVARSDVADRQR